MRFGLLGPLTITHAGRSVSVGRSQRRGLLSYLLLHPGRWVSADAIIEALWGGAEPASARQQIQTSVHAIRTELRRIGADDALLGGGSGYRLELAPDQLDLSEFADLVVAAHRASESGAYPDAERKLDAGLALWRGQALADASGAFVEQARASLEDQRLSATEDLFAVRLALGRHAEVLAALGPLVQAHPLRERLRGQQMLALYRGGRQVEALEAYRAFRDLLAEEHGIDPGPELQALERTILAGEPVADGRPATDPGQPTEPERIDLPEPEPPTHPVPAQLPAPVTAFVGRSAELAALDAVLARADDGGLRGPGMVLISTVDGAGGIGKTATAVAWAHRVRDRFPDGQLYVNLHGYSTMPAVQPLEALSRMLEALGVTPERVPVDLEAAASLYRTLLAGRQVLVLLDNANHVEQVRPLLPGHPDCLALITSRDRLTGLIAREGARRITLGTLTPVEAVQLLGRIVGEDRVAAEPAAAAELARYCAYLPLALRIVAANLYDRPATPLAAYVAQLGAARLDALEVEDDPQTSVRVIMEQSYELLDPPVRRLFRLLALVPGPDVTAPMAAAMAGVSVADVAAGLDRLTAAHLLAEVAPGRYAMHDLVRLFARERSGVEDPTAQRDEALDRLYTYLLMSLDVVATLLYPQFLRLAVVPTPDLEPDRPADEAAALAWVEENLPSLVAAIRWAAEEGPYRAACALADAMRGFFWVRRHMADWFDTARAGYWAAARTGDERLVTAAAMSMGLAYRSQADYQQSAEYLERALTASRAAGWVEAEASVLGSLAIVHADLADNVKAVRRFTEALELNQRVGRRAGEAVVRGNLASLRLRIGELRLASADCLEALAIYREVHSLGGEAIVLTNLALGVHSLGELDQALAYVEQGLELHERIGDRYGGTLSRLARAQIRVDLGDLAGAIEDAVSALDTSRQIQDVVGESTALTVLAMAILAQGDPERALRGFVETVRVSRIGSNGYAESEAQIGASRALLALGRVDEAVSYAAAALEVARGQGLMVLVGQALTALAAGQVAAGDVDGARDSVNEALVVHRATGHRTGEARTLVVVGRLESVLGHADRATRHWRTALAMLTAMGCADAAVVASLLGVG